MRKSLTVLYFYMLSLNCVLCNDTQFILHDKCINVLYRPATVYFNDSAISVHRDSRGIILRFELKNAETEYYKLTDDTLNKLIKIQDFLAKNKNPAIIEVHVSDVSSEDLKKLKKWEISAVIAGNIGSVFNANGNWNDRQVSAIGYGEFLPSNNTSNNGGKISNRVDIIILCNINGE